MKLFTSICLLTAGLLPTASAISTIVAKGSKFFTSDGNQFYIKGIAYQLTNDDPLANGNQCQLDVNLMQTLGTNAIRVYHVDPSANHDQCMQALANAGIYVFLDLDTFDTYIMETPGQPQWTQAMFQRYSAVIDAFHNYDNVAGFFVGNEVLNSGADSVAAPYVKAAARDLKAYQASKNYRSIPIGYSAADIPSLRPNLQNYLACGSNPANAIDFFSLNAYEWCGDSSYQTSGYSSLQAMAANYSLPIFFSETGCVTVRPRTFGDQAAILGPDMDNTWSGAIIYEWIEEQNDYGIISYGPPAASGAPDSNSVVGGFTRAGTPTPIQPDFSNLNNQWKTLSPTGVQIGAYSPSNSPPACPAYTPGSWLVSGDAPLPTLGAVYAGSSNAGATTSGGSLTSGGQNSPMPSSLSSSSSMTSSTSSTSSSSTIMTSSIPSSSSSSSSSSGSALANGLTSPPGSSTSATSGSSSTSASGHTSSFVAGAATTAGSGSGAQQSSGSKSAVATGGASRVRNVGGEGNFSGIIGVLGGLAGFVLAAAALL